MVIKIARRKVTRRYYGRARRGYRKRKGLLSGAFGYIALGAAAGFAEKFIPPILGKWTAPAVIGAAGFFFKKPALMAVAGYTLGKMFTGGGGGNPGHNPGFFE